LLNPEYKQDLNKAITAFKDTVTTQDLVIFDKQSDDRKISTVKTKTIMAVLVGNINTEADEAEGEKTQNAHTTIQIIELVQEVDIKVDIKLKKSEQIPPWRRPWFSKSPLSK
jgi:hypothetical protein